MNWRRYNRELSAFAALTALLVVLAVLAPAFFRPENLRDLAVNNMPVLIVACGMTLVILTGEIDISVGSQFAIYTVAAGLLAKAGLPLPLMIALVLSIGLAMGALNGALVGWLRLPSIIVTLAMLVAWRDGLRWGTSGAWVLDLPPNFQWFGLSQARGQIVIVGVGILLLIALAWSLRNFGAGRAVYAVGSDTEAARLAGIEPRRVVFAVFGLMGTLTGLAALLNAIRFSTVPGNSGAGLELKAIAAVVVGGTAITGGRGRLVGTLIGVALLGTVGTALTFLGVSAFWEKAIQGAIILAALVTDVLLARLDQWQQGGGWRAARSK
jgi:rhamnose transport system permease protein